MLHPAKHFRSEWVACGMARLSMMALPCDFDHRLVTIRLPDRHPTPYPRPHGQLVVNARASGPSSPKAVRATAVRESCSDLVRGGNCQPCDCAAHASTADEAYRRHADHALAGTISGAVTSITSTSMKPDLVPYNLAMVREHVEPHAE